MIDDLVEIARIRMEIIETTGGARLLHLHLDDKDTLLDKWTLRQLISRLIDQLPNLYYAHTRPRIEVD